MRLFKNSFILALILCLGFNTLSAQSYLIVDSGQSIFYNNESEINAPQDGESFFGQDAGIDGHQPDYTDNGDGTVTDNVTGLMWQQSADLNGDGTINIEDKLSYSEALAGADTFSLAGYDDWRLPTIKESYSLIMFTGEDPSGWNGSDTDELTPFIDTGVFEIGFGDTDAGERIIDSQFASSTLYVSTTMNGDETMFGVNLVDGRIKGYPTGPMPGSSEDKQYYVLYVRGNPAYGQNNYTDNGDGTVSDSATGLMWEQGDSEVGMNWEAALEWAQTKSAVNHLGYSDWRLPNAKELQSIVDYSRSPATTESAAIDPVFACTMIQDEGGEDNYPFYWSSTTHANMENGAWGVYLCFGEGLGFMPEPVPPFNTELLDVHGAGAQRSDPKTGSADDYPEGHGPQGDVVRIDNYVRLVRDIETATGIEENRGDNIQQPETPLLEQNYPNPFNPETTLRFTVSNDSWGSLTIFDLAGNQIKVLAEGIQTAGTHEFTWRGRDARDQLVPTGIYFARLETRTASSTIKMIYVK